LIDFDRLIDNLKLLAIYIHWPFCLSKCPYCDFCSFPLNDAKIYEDFGGYLLMDLRQSLAEIENPSIKSVFFGGGTPSLMAAQAVEGIVEFLDKNYSMAADVEITMEANPGTFDAQKMADFRAAGVNRLSLGIQSFSDENLRFLGRIYGAKQARAAAEIVAKTFENFNFDLMYGYNEQADGSLASDLRLAVDFGCQHISCYQLTFEGNTPFHDRLLSGDIKRIGEDQEVAQYNFINIFLKNHNILRYEVSNYAMAGYQSKHNLAYWMYEDYLGVGPAAHSRITTNEDGNNRKNEIVRISDPFGWAKACSANDRKTLRHVKKLTQLEELQEIIIVGLRMTNGLKISDIHKRIPKKIFDKIICFEKILALRKQNLIENDDEILKITERGFLKMNSIIEYLLG
jgi:oxygen-independent coproporphyrinogen-3 oxidase